MRRETQSRKNLSITDAFRLMSKLLTSGNRRKQDLFLPMQKKIMQIVERKKCVVMFGDTEKDQKIKVSKKQENPENTKEILNEINELERKKK